jgi:hypothetical protein
LRFTVTRKRQAPAELLAGRRRALARERREAGKLLDSIEYFKRKWATSQRAVIEVRLSYQHGDAWPRVDKTTRRDMVRVIARRLQRERRRRADANVGVTTRSRRPPMAR